MPNFITLGQPLLGEKYVAETKKKNNHNNSAGANGGPRSQVCTRLTLRSAPHQHQRRFFGIIYFLLTMLHTNQSTEWSSWSACSHSCGGGIQERTERVCEHSGECETTSQALRACALHLCPPPFSSWRDEQCAGYNVTLVREYHKWVSTMNRDGPCSLDCRSVDQPGVVQRFSDPVQDGPFCGDGG